MKYKKNLGQAYPEYIVGAVVMMGALFTPLPQDLFPEAEGRSASAFLVEAIKRNHEAYIWSMSVPTDIIE